MFDLNELINNLSFEVDGGSLKKWRKEFKIEVFFNSSKKTNEKSRKNKK